VFGEKSGVLGEKRTPEGVLGVSGTKPRPGVRGCGPSAAPGWSEGVEGRWTGGVGESRLRCAAMVVAVSPKDV